MKTPLIRIVAILSVLTGALAIHAQMPAQQGGGQWSGQPPTVDQRLQRMSQMLDLTGDQQEKIRPILESESTQMQQLRSDTSLSQEDRMAKMKQIREGSSSQINAVLTPDQQKKYAEMISHMGRGRGQGQGQGAAPPPPSPQQ